MKLTFDELIDNKDNARKIRDFRSYDRDARLENLAEPLVGELNGGVHYINLTDRCGHPTGKTKRSTSKIELIQYLVRNGYVR